MAIEDIVRRGESPPRSTGYRADSTRDVNPGTPTTVFGDTINPQPTPFATTDDSNNLGRWPQRDLALANGEELASVDILVAGAYEVDPNVVSIWNLTVVGSSLTLSFAALSALSEELTRSVWNGARRVRTVQVNLSWAGAGTRTVTLPGVAFSNGAAPDWTQTAGLDIIQVQIDSAGNKYGFVAALDAREPS